MYVIDEDDYLAHYGMMMRSGRYPWGSGGTPMQNHRSFLAMVDAMRAEGLNDTDIAKGFGIEGFSTNDFRALRSIANNEVKAARVSQAERLRDTGMSYSAIATEMGLKGESNVRALLTPGSDKRAKELEVATSAIRDEMAKGGYLDIGAGAHLALGVSRTQFDTAIAAVRNDGYKIEKVQIEQVGSNGRMTNAKVLVPEGVTYKDIVTNKEAIKSMSVHIKDDVVETVRAPVMLDSKRLKINYAEDGGTEADGTMYIRPGAKDLDMGGVNYAQVRIAVDGSHYLKGMAIYKNDLPDGVDVMFNTNKSNTGNKLDALKEMNMLPKTDKDGVILRDAKGKPIPGDKLDVDNPFGAMIKPGGQRGALNILNEEGDWHEWSKSLPSQMLSKQNKPLVQEQLTKAQQKKREELDEILALTNPAVKKKLLQSYSDDVDSAAVHLKAAAIPNQATQVIIPIPKMKDTEIYAPNFTDGDRVALVRFPHGGTFEIPELTVNNRQPDAKKLLGPQAKDAVGINAKVAERLSGADFDGDTVLVIPNNSGKIKSTAALEGLKNFDGKKRYPGYEGMKPMSDKTLQMEMGMASNLITDMTIKGANNNEIAAAVRHSMVVIDAKKHKLNYKQSAIDNNIASLKKKYQSKADSEGLGASTLISQSTSTKRVNQRKMGYKIDPDTGEKIFTETGKGYFKKDPKTGEVTDKWIPKLQESSRGAETKDAFTLSSGTPIEALYANHSNKLKAMGNEARKSLVSTKSVPYSPTAKKIYSNEVETLNAKLNVALKNAPRERQAQILANAVVKQKVDANPAMQNDELKKVKSRAVAVARARTGAKKDLVQITDNEWEAIQAGAITNNKLSAILNNADLNDVKRLATPRQNTVMTDAKQARAKQLMASGRTTAEIASILGVPRSTLQSSMK